MEDTVTTLRLPAEWEEQDAILLAWPHAETDWCPLLDEVTAVYLDLVQRISHYQPLIILTPEADCVRRQLETVTTGPHPLHLVPCPTNDTWIRDFGPITRYRRKQTELLDFGFNGWGLKFAADDDNCATRILATHPPLQGCRLHTIGLILEGGSIETDGKGTLLTTSTCLLEKNRNPHLSRHQLEHELRQLLGVKRLLWLDHGWLAGDDTDAHIDTLARLAPGDTILYVRCDDEQDEHFLPLQRMEEQLKSFTTAGGKPFRLLPLPWPQAHYDEGRRLPATYANFLVINGAVLMPCYQDPADAKALEVVATAFPDRRIIGIDCRTLIKQHGSLHCITMQLPKGALS